MFSACKSWQRHTQIAVVHNWIYLKTFKKILFPLFSLFLCYLSIELMKDLISSEPKDFSSIEVLIISFLLALFITGVFAFIGFAYPSSRILSDSYYKIKNPKSLNTISKVLGIRYFRLLLLFAAVPDSHAIERAPLDLSSLTFSHSCQWTVVFASAFSANADAQLKFSSSLCELEWPWAQIFVQRVCTGASKSKTIHVLHFFPGFVTLVCRQCHDLNDRV